MLTYDHLDEAITLDNAVPQGLSSSIFTLDIARRTVPGRRRVGLRVANVNIGASGAEIGGTLGGEKRPAAVASPGLIVEGLHAPRDQHYRLLRPTSAGAGRVSLSRCCSTMNSTTGRNGFEDDFYADSLGDVLTTKRQNARTSC